MTRNRTIGGNRHPRNALPGEGDGRILPLINIVFLLLIFFMLAGRLAFHDPFRLDPPRSSNAATAPVHELVVLAAADGRLGLNGKVVGAAKLRSEVSRLLSGGAATAVHLMADRRAEATHIAAVLELLQESGVKKLRLLTLSANH